MNIHAMKVDVTGVKDEVLTSFTNQMDAVTFLEEGGYQRVKNSATFYKKGRREVIYLLVSDKVEEHGSAYESYLKDII